MARKKTPAEKFRQRLDGLSAGIGEDLRLSSLADNRLEGYAYLFRLVLPLLNAQGKRVFTDPILEEQFRVLDDRFGAAWWRHPRQRRRCGDCGTHPRKVRRRKTI